MMLEMYVVLFTLRSLLSSPIVSIGVEIWWDLQEDCSVTAEYGLLSGREEHGPWAAGGVLQELHRGQHGEPHILLATLSAQLPSRNKVLQVKELSPEKFGSLTNVPQ